MKKPLAHFAMLALGCLAALADEPSVTGRWATAPDAPTQVKLSIARTNTGYSISHYWTGANAMAMNTADYPSPVQKASGSFVSSDTDSSLPAKLNYAVKGDTLTLQVPAGNFAGTHTLKRVLVTTPAAATAWAKAKKNKSLALTDVLGSWQAPETAAIQAMVVIEKGKADGEVAVTQQWSDDLSSAMAMNIPYKVTSDGGMIILTAIKADTAAPQLNVLQVARDGNNLLVTLLTGHHAGTYLLPKTP